MMNKKDISRFLDGVERGTIVRLGVREFSLTARVEDLELEENCMYVVGSNVRHTYNKSGDSISMRTNFIVPYDQIHFMSSDVEVFEQ